MDQIWLADFAQRGYLTDLTNYVKSWGRVSDWYQTNFDGGVYNGKVQGIWAWTDVRGMWYWKDLLSKSGVDPSTLQTWHGYIASARKMNSVLGPMGISGAVLVGLNYSPDVWCPYLWMLGPMGISGAVLVGLNYSPDVWCPYLWMLGRDILVMKDGHPTKGPIGFLPIIAPRVLKR